ncbi:Xanthine/uracil permease [Propionibacterium freudenreichii]|uniref:solute carrier family 23 protein n=2 Tax=Propionibacterium TaxID=1743 RepID=UPI0005A5C6F7|nr:solute carrier family 23 protein [Propionibacterium freudenreichii]CEI28319.1 Xanthine/uracil permease [Propionibacterium freudenreichii]
MSLTATAPAVKDPVDRVPPIPKLTILGLQHVLAFYAGAVIVPLVIAQGLGLDSATTIHLINADLFTCGIASIIQSAGLGPKIGVRMPLLQGVTFTAVSPLIAIGLAGGGGVGGLATMYGSIIVAGLATFFVAPFFAKLLRFFPPVVTGTLLTIMGTTLLSVAANDIVSWGTAAAKAGGSPIPGTMRGLIYALGTLAVIVLVQWLFKGFMATISVLIGLVAGTVVAIFLGDADFSGVGQAAAFGVTTPFFFGMPKFSVGAIISMLIVMAITAVETTGDVFATGEVVGKRITSKHVANALRADGLATTLGGVLNSFPYTCFAQNVGLVRLTRVKSRWVVTMAGAIMIVLGILPKAGAIVDAIPTPVIGGASLAMFASVAVVGIQTLGKADMHDNRNAVIVSTSIGLALLVTLKPDLAGMVPSWLSIFFGSGVTFGSIVAIVLNIAFFHIGPHRSPDVARSKKGRNVSLDQVNRMGKDEFVDTFGELFSGTTWPVESAWELRPFNSTTELRQAFEDSVLTAEPSCQKDLVRGYFDIADLVSDENGDLQAQIDTGSVALDRMDDVQRQEVRAASHAYRDRFDMPMVIAVENLASREQLVKDAWRRVEHSPELERRIAVAQVVAIADNRFTKLVADANPIRNAWSRKFEQLDE